MMNQTNRLALAAVVDRIWAIDPVFGLNAAQVLEGILPAPKADGREDGEGSPQQATKTAVIPIMGAMAKRAYSSTFSGCSTVEARRQIRSAARDPEVSRIVLWMDSPGGSVDGTADLADEVRAAKESKPVIAFIDGMCCSAALWVASQATEVVANPNSLYIGSIGTFGVLYDYSAMYEEAGVKAYLISSGGEKGHPCAGVPIPKEVIASYQDIVDHITDEFIACIAAGRGLRAEDVADLATGKTWVAADAVKLGLVDRASSWDALVASWDAVPAAAEPPAEEEEEDEDFICPDAALPTHEMSFIDKITQWFSGGGQEPASEDFVDVQMEKIAEALGAAFVERTMASLTGAKKLTPEREAAARESLMTALKADGGGRLQISDGQIVHGASTKAVLDLLESMSPLPLGDATLPSTPGAQVVLVTGDAAADKAAQRKAYVQGAPQTLQKEPAGK